MQLNEQYFSDTKYLNEMAVTLLPEYYNEDFKEKVMNVSQIINAFDFNENNAKKVSVRCNNELSFEYNMLIFKNFSVEWLKELKVLLSNRSQITSGNEANDGNGYATLAKTAYYCVWFDWNRKGNIENTHFSRTENNFVIYDGFERFPDYIQRNGSIETATFVFDINNTDSDEDLFFIIYHELTHLHKIVTKNLSLEQMNKSHLIGDYMQNNPEYNNLRINQINNFLNKDYNQFVTYQKKAELVSKMNIHDLFAFNIKNAYLMNPNEIDAHLSNIISQLNKCSIDELLPKDNTQSLAEIEYVHSKIYRQFYNLKDVLELFIQYIPDDVKLQFVEEYIKNFHAVEFPEPVSYQYDRQFKYNGKYTIESFDLFYSYHRNNIINMLKEVEDVHKDLIKKKQNRKAQFFEAALYKRTHKSWLLHYYLEEK